MEATARRCNFLSSRINVHIPSHSTRTLYTSVYSSSSQVRRYSPTPGQVIGDGLRTTASQSVSSARQFSLKDLECNMYNTKILLLLLLGFSAALNIAEALPKPKASYFNFTHVNDDGSFFASYHSKDKKHQYLDESDENQSDKIYGGSNAALGQFPFMAIIHRLTGNGQYFVCGGSILSARWVLTAGHCVSNKPQKFFVVFGVVDKSGFGYDYLTGDGVSMISTQGALHPNYAEEKHDIGLLYMPKDIPFSKTVQPIRLAGQSYQRQTFASQTGHIYGWGKDQQDGRAISKLKYGRVPIISNGMCRRSWNVDYTHICTDSSTGQDVCQGDSGGPLVVLEQDDEPLQVGIVSYGDIYCPSSRPSVFTRVSAYTTWIKRVTGIEYE